jgi:hypothetical protein
MPLTHAVAIARAVYSGVYPRRVLFNIAVGLVLGLAAFVVGIRRMKKRLIK